MNLYIINQTRRGAVFGVGTYIRELVTALNIYDINICVINLISASSQIEYFECDGVNYWNFPIAISDRRTISNDEQWSLYYRSIVYLLQVHIVDREKLVFHLNFYESAKLVDELKAAFDCKVVATSHFFNWGFTIYDNHQQLRAILDEKQNDALSIKLRKTIELEKQYYSKADHVICLSNYMKAILCNDYGINTFKVSVVHNGLSSMDRGLETNENIRKKWGISLDEKIILYAGRVDEVKGVIFLIKAFKGILKEHRNSRLIIAGSGDYEKCFQEAKDICSHVSFTGLLNKQDLYDFYQIADVGVIPSLFEPFGYVAVEMMKHQLPLVYTETSGLVEVVDSTCGLSTPIVRYPDKVEVDVPSLTCSISYLLNNPASAKLLGTNGKHRFLNCFTSDVFGQNMFKVYKSLFE